MIHAGVFLAIIYAFFSSPNGPQAEVNMAPIFGYASLYEFGFFAYGFGYFLRWFWFYIISEIMFKLFTACYFFIYLSILGEVQTICKLIYLNFLSKLIFNFNLIYLVKKDIINNLKNYNFNIYDWTNLQIFTPRFTVFKYLIY